MMNSTDVDLPPANTPAEVNIHLGYIRRDIRTLTDTTNLALGNLAKKIDELDDHYITESKFRPIADDVKAHDNQLKELTEWRDTFNGKLVGFGCAIAAASTLASFVLNYFVT